MVVVVLVLDSGSVSEGLVVLSLLADLGLVRSTVWLGDADRSGVSRCKPVSLDLARLGWVVLLLDSVLDEAGSGISEAVSFLTTERGLLRSGLNLDLDLAKAGCSGDEVVDEAFEAEVELVAER
jgi:hypothetical protein